MPMRTIFVLKYFFSISVQPKSRAKQSLPLGSLVGNFVADAQSGGNMRRAILSSLPTFIAPTCGPCSSVLPELLASRFLFTSVRVLAVYHHQSATCRSRYFKHRLKFIGSRHTLFERLRSSQLLFLGKAKEAKEMAVRENIFTIPNLLCVSRMAMTPYIGYLVVQEDFRLACLVTAVAGITDLADGFIARRFPSQRSMAGSYLDPLADKVLVTTLCLSLTYVGLIPVPLAALIILRDVLLVAAACVVRYRSLPAPVTVAKYFDVAYATANLSPTKLSKYNTGIQLAMVIASLCAPVFGYVDHEALQAIWVLTAASTIASGFSYAVQKGTYRMLTSGARRRAP